MNTEIPSVVIASLARQLAFVSAVVGGFAITYLAVLLSMADRRRIIGVAAGFAMFCAANLLVCALAWSLYAGMYEAKPTGFTVPVAEFQTKLRWLNGALVAGLVCFLAALGLGGWIRSRSLGVVTTGFALLALIAVAFVLRGVVV